MSFSMPLQPVSLDIWDKKYRLYDSNGVAVDQDIDQQFDRVATALAGVESPESRTEWKQKFLDAMYDGAIPAGRIMSNAGASTHKSAVSLINCLGGNTQVLTDKGLVSIRDLAGTRVKVLNGAGHWTEVLFSFHGIQKTYRLKFLRNDRTLLVRATINHNWILSNGVTVTTKDLMNTDNGRWLTVQHITDKGPEGEWVFSPSNDYESCAFEEEVYCCEEPTTHSFVLGNGLLTGNCTVSKDIEDSMEGIFSALHEAALTLKSGCGIGYCFSTLRPEGSFVHGAGATTSGPLSFMDVFDKMCSTVSSAGGRRGAQMGTFAVTHKDVEKFVRAKRENGRLRQFNLSLLITDSFIEAVKNDSHWQFTWNGVACGESVRARWLWDLIMTSTYNYAEPGFLLVDRINRYNNMWFTEHIQSTNPCFTADTKVTVFDNDRGFYKKDIKDVIVGDQVLSFVATHTGGYNVNSKVVASGKTRINAQVVRSHFKLTGTESFYIDHTPDHKFYNINDYTWEILPFKDPRIPVVFSTEFQTQNSLTNDFAFLDHQEAIENQDVYDITVEDTHCFFANDVLVHNCGEQPLPANSACLLGSINLTKFVDNPFSSKAVFNFEKYGKTVQTFTRMLDNVVEINGLPLKAQQQELTLKRRHGMGYMGLGSAMAMLGIDYGSKNGVRFTREVTSMLAINGYIAGAELAQEKGEAPILKQSFSSKDIEGNLKYNTNFVQGRRKTFKGRELFLQSHYFDIFNNYADSSNVLAALKRHGSRFTHATSIAPTGCCVSSTRIITNSGVRSYQDILDENKIDWRTIEKTNEKEWFDIKPFSLPSKDLISDTCDKIWYNGQEPTYIITFADQTIFECTGNHKLFIKHSDQEVWTEVQYLVGDEKASMRSFNRSVMQIVSIQLSGKTKPTWDISVLKQQCYLLENGVLSHNTTALSFGNNCCVAKGTLVQTAFGRKPIEEVDLNDLIFFFDPVKDIFQYANIEFVGLTRANAEVYEVVLCSGHSVILTYDHKLLTFDEVYTYFSVVELISMKEKPFIVYMTNDSDAEISEIFSITLLSDRTDTYDITVKTTVDANRNFVANGIVVHNSNGIEPSFAHSYTRNIIRQGRNAKESVEVQSYEYLSYKTLVNKNVRPEFCGNNIDDGNYLPSYFANTDTLTPKQHIDVQAAAQDWIDSSISKTINIPTTMPFEEFKDVYMHAYESGLKGCTTYRYNPENFQGVLVKADDLKNTKYRFMLEDGTHVDLPGNEMVEYAGQHQIAANLFESIKENSFGKH